MAEISIEGRRVAYSEWGSGAPVVLLHAGASSGKQWAKTARLLEVRFWVIAPDLWGFGGTERWSGRQELTHDHQALLVARVIEHLCKEPVHLVGHSYGGATAVRVILQNRELVRTAVLIEPILTPLLRLAGEEKLFREVLRHGPGFLGKCQHRKRGRGMADLPRLPQRSGDVAGIARTVERAFSLHDGEHCNRLSI